MNNNRIGYGLKDKLMLKTPRDSTRIKGLMTMHGITLKVKSLKPNKWPVDGGGLEIGTAMNILAHS